MIYNHGSSFPRFNHGSSFPRFKPPQREITRPTENLQNHEIFFALTRAHFTWRRILTQEINLFESFWAQNLSTTRFFFLIFWVLMEYGSTQGREIKNPSTANEIQRSINLNRVAGQHEKKIKSQRKKLMLNDSEHSVRTLISVSQQGLVKTWTCWII